MPSRPDILLLVLDTQRRDRLSLYGYERETSPNLDQFAADATIFDQAHSTAQWTVPSHASMFTGLYPTAHTTVQSSSFLPGSLTPLAERLRNGGYFTAAFCNNPLVGVVNNGLRRGFQSWLNYSGWMTSRPNQAGIRPGPLSRYRQFFKRNLAGTVQWMQDIFARSDAMLAFAFTPIMVPLWQTALSFKGNTPKSLSDTAKLFIERKGVAPNQPIFSFVNLMGTHLPFHPLREYMQEFAPEVLADPEARHYLRRFNSDVFGWLTPIADKMPEDHKSILDGMYDAEVATQDQHLGHFFRRMKESGALENTLIMVVADHGEMLGEKNLLGHTHSLYNELTHVPLIVRDPSGGLTKGGAVGQPVSTRRVFHTALAAAELATDHEQRFALDRLGASDPDKGTVFAEGITPQNVLNLMKRRHPELVARHHCDQFRRAVWQGDEKLIVTGSVRRELYNVIADPKETANRLEAQPQRAEQLHDEIRAFAGEVNASKAAAERIDGVTDPQLANRLRALGYLD